MINNSSGNLIIIGGAEDKNGKKEILKKVCECIDKDKDQLLIATIATEYPEEVANKYTDVFSSLGVKNIEILDINSRSEAFVDNNIELVSRSKAIFFTGGDQLRITSLLGGTPVYKKILDAYNNGSHIVGTSAGASVMSNTMIVEGEDDEDPRKCILKMAPGLGLVDNIIIDQHFVQRGRIGRLLTGVAQNPQVLGIGIDENTAIILRKDGTIKVLGSGAVYFIDGSEISYSNISEQHSDEVLSIFNVRIHVLKNGDRYNLESNAPFEEGNR